MITKSNTFTILSQPFYDQYNKCYKNILSVNMIPNGPLNPFVKRIHFPKLSPFQMEGPCNPIPKCGLVIQNLSLSSTLNTECNKCCNLMTPNEIPDLIAFLMSNGYQIETQITNMLNQSSVKLLDRKIVFNVTYYEQNQQPNITYIR